ncbi:hypothetical protein Ctob_008250, partial [Chrysochromulina tobinii]
CLRVPPSASDCLRAPPSAPLSAPSDRRRFHCMQPGWRRMASDGL